jgi:hypothetical protein
MGTHPRQSGNREDDLPRFSFALRLLGRISTRFP